MSRQILVSVLKRALFHSASILPIFSFGGQKLRIAMYHGVDDIKFPKSTFESHLKFYTHHFETYFASEVPQLLNNQCRTSSGKPPIVLTFDDGLKNNATIVAPLVEQYNAKATFYLISGLLSGSQMIWNHELFCRLALLSHEQRAKVHPALANPHNSLSQPDTADTRHIKQFIDQVKRWPSIEKQQLLQDLRQAYPDALYTEQMKQSYEIMSIDDAKQLPSCIEIGSHTKTHSILDTLPLEEGKKEVIDSKNELEAMLERAITTFCYPNGNYTAELADEVAKHYAIGVTTKEGFAHPKDSQSLLNRISSRVSLLDMCSQLISPR